ncbi:MAG: hypothetical protein RhofKO_26340 [Rhodothermales bacterium]
MTMKEIRVPSAVGVRHYDEIGIEEVDRGFADPVLISHDTGTTTDAIVLDETQGRTEHRDLSDIAATETDGITINRTKSGISPFVPIVKTPNYAANSGNLTGYSVEIEDEGSTTGYKHLGNVSASYLLLTNEEVRALALEIAQQSELPFKESRIYWDGSRFCHVIDFLETREVEHGDEVGLSLITRSSYDKSWRYESALMGKRFVCDNGALSGEFFARVSFKHMKSAGSDAEQWKSIVRQGLKIIDRAPENLQRFVNGLRLLKRTKMTDARLRETWRLFPRMGDRIKGQIMSRYVEHEDPTLFGFFNAGTNVFWHREKMTSADFSHNDAFTTQLLSYAFERLN